MTPTSHVCAAAACCLGLTAGLSGSEVLQAPDTPTTPAASSAAGAGLAAAAGSACGSATGSAAGGLVTGPSVVDVAFYQASNSCAAVVERLRLQAWLMNCCVELPKLWLRSRTRAFQNGCCA
jgi:hypothetical protein